MVDSIIISGGTNDLATGNPYSASADELKTALAEIVRRAKARPNIRDIIVMNIIPNENHPAEIHAERLEYNAWLTGFAESEGLYLFDWDALVRSADGTAISMEYQDDFDGGNPDGVHLDIDGGRVTGEALDAFIRRIRGSP